MTIAKETISRAVKHVETRTRSLRSTRRLERFDEKNSHTIDNRPAPSRNRVAIYRWVDKIQRFQSFTYPDRLLLELQ